MQEVRRDDGELCGFVTAEDGRWWAMAVFGAALSQHDGEEDARRHVIGNGLAALADRWTLIDSASGDEQVVCIQHASPAEVSVALGYHAVPGVKTLTIPAAELASGRWRLEHRA